MPVLEIALLHIRSATSESPSTSVDNPLTPYIKQALHHALHVLRATTPERYTFTLLQQHEDPSYLYIVGFWSSVEAHEAFLPSEENKGLLSSLEGQVDVEWMYHAQIATSTSKDTIVSDASSVIEEAPVIAIGRHGVEGANKAAFEEAWRAGSGGLASFSGRSPVGGWRVGRVYGAKKEDAGEGEEWLLFSGWDAVEKHSEFAASDAFKEYSKIKPYVATFDVRHARKVTSSAEKETSG
ncbi:hypothetical protein FRC04_007282 [Tulasnella sp. 424]|nr:hypothetical protein FRC04_007282 [Tulasnella sp. 424]KAG8976210.1 hypothetical protein FRC05_004460 [Tulasnella sp. 425]